MKKPILVGALVIVALAAAAHWHFSDRGRFTTDPEFTGLGRTESGNDLVSRNDPAAILRFDAAYARWPDLEQPHLDRVRQSLGVLPLPVENQTISTND